MNVGDEICFWHFGNKTYGKVINIYKELMGIDSGEEMVVILLHDHNRTLFDSEIRLRKRDIYLV